MKYLLLLTGLCFAVLACNDNQSPEKDRTQTGSDSAIFLSGSSSAAVEDNKDTVHKFIRTAELKFKVSNVEKITYKIEDILTTHGGYVTLTQLNSTIDNALITPISTDSSVEKTSYTVTNTMIVRVPNIKLDTALKDIARLVDYLDYRVIKATDVSLQLQANHLSQKRGSQHAARLVHAIDKQGKKLAETAAAEELLQKGQAEMDDALLSNRQINDQVNFSTLQLLLYQRQAIKTELVPNNKNIVAYEPGFGTKVLNSLQSGLRLLENLFVGLLQWWPFFLLAFIGMAMYKKYFYLFKKVNRAGVKR